MSMARVEGCFGRVYTISDAHRHKRGGKGQKKRNNSYHLNSLLSVNSHGVPEFFACFIAC